MTLRNEGSRSLQQCSPSSQAHGERLNEMAAVILPLDTLYRGLHLIIYVCHSVKLTDKGV